MTNAFYIPGFPIVVKRSDWSSGANVKADFESEWKIVFNASYTFIITLWEGPNDPDDYAFLVIANNAVVAWIDFASTPPLEHPSFVIDFYVLTGRGQYT
jgi:hypothetical protein